MMEILVIGLVLLFLAALIPNGKPCAMRDHEYRD
jgi:hypothetical protein